MKTFCVPNQHFSQCGTSFDKIKLLVKAGAEAVIDQVNWENDFPKILPVTVKVAHDGERLYLYYQVTGEAVRAANTEDFGSVWEDSCVEFFMQREGETVYRNFECNILGALLAAHHETREKSTPLKNEVPLITRKGSICHRYEQGRQVSDWTLFLEIPKQAMGFAAHESLAGQKIRANFYKCGDKTPEPHFLSWSPIELPKPNFHVPQFFGLLELE
ncbi:MAG: carbohydrate-binding family 9-like protein [Proteiniphilum sp.]